MIAFKKPVVKDYRGDLSREWYVYFSVFHAELNKMIPIKKYEGLNKIMDLQQRTEAAESLRQFWEQKLQSGWTPWNDSNFVYSSEIEPHIQKRFNVKKCGNKRSFDYLATKFLTEKVYPRRLKPKSVAAYKSKLRQFELWLQKKDLHDKDIACITHDVIVDFFTYLIIDENRNRLTCEKYMQVLNAFFASCTNVNPVHDIILPRYVETDTNRPINRADRQKFIETLQTDPWLWLAVQFITYCAVRCGEELRHMQIGWIDFDRGRLIIPPDMNKTNVSTRIIIPDHFFTKLKTVYNLHLYNKEYYIFTRNNIPGPEKMGQNTMRNRFNKIRDDLNMPKNYKFYSWKHTGAQMASDEGIPVKHIQMHLRHSSLDTTDKYLSKLRGFDSEPIKRNFPEL